LEQKDLQIAQELIAVEEELDELQAEYKQEYRARLNQGICEPATGIFYLELLESLEHISDQTATVAISFQSNS